MCEFIHFQILFICLEINFNSLESETVDSEISIVDNNRVETIV